MTSDGSGGGPRSLPLILARELAANLATPMFLIDAGGSLVFCTEAAELMIGRSFGELGVMAANTFSDMIQASGLDGEPMRRRDTPPGRAFYNREPAHQSMLMTNLDGVRKQVEVTAYPLFGRDDDMHGVLTVFWEAAT